MRGSPLLRALIAFFVIGLTAWPLSRLTRHAEANIAPPQIVQESKAATVHLEMAFTQLPKRVAVMSLGKEIWASEVTEPKIEQDLTLSWPPEGVDLRFEIAWPEDAPLAAARVHITAPDGRELEQSI